MHTVDKHATMLYEAPFNTITEETTTSKCKRKGLDGERVVHH